MSMSLQSSSVSDRGQMCAARASSGDGLDQAPAPDSAQERPKVQNKRLATLLLLCILSVQCTWCTVVISRLAFRHEAHLVAGVFEDAMISMTYARNLLDGFGLNWARYGTPVEGFTHPLWLLLMIGANLMPVERALKGFFVQGASLGILLLLVLESARVARRHYTQTSQ